MQTARHRTIEMWRGRKKNHREHDCTRFLYDGEMVEVKRDYIESWLCRVSLPARVVGGNTAEKETLLF